MGSTEADLQQIGTAAALIGGIGGVVAGVGSALGLLALAGAGSAT
ncbi:hypothetical protein [Rhodococcus sp. UNC363MFTsu5.1]|nr:hypothetical protein [Rhodococcus sp. UNC363MFTsu5.1]